MAAEESLRHVLVVPWIGEGHVNGMLRFAQLLASQQGLLVTFGYPARAHALARKHNKLAHLPHSLYVQIIEDGLPSPEDEAPTTAQFRSSPSYMQHAIEALLQEHLQNSAATPHSDGIHSNRYAAMPHVNNDVHGVEDHGCSLPTYSSWPPISCIISDTFLPGTQDLADKFGIPRVDFWTSNATVYYMVLHLPEIIARGHLPLPEGTGEKWKVRAPPIDFIPGLPPFDVTALPMELIKTSDASDPRYQFMLKAFSRARDADRILVHSLYELESHVYDAVQAQGIPMYPIGPLLEATSDVAANHSECLQWLDKQESASVVYVAFGTLARLTLQEMHATALGLEASGQPFLWVVRTDSLPTGWNLCENLPDGFIERTISKGKGFIVPWAPQTEVLKHSVVGAFISHCGWNSTLESLWEGVPIVVCPRAAEQRCNAKSVVEDWKIGVEVERQEDGSFTKEALQEAIQEMMTKHEAYKERALHLKEMARHTIAHGTSRSNIVNFVEHLRHLPIPRCPS